MNRGLMLAVEEMADVINVDINVHKFVSDMPNSLKKEEDVGGMLDYWYYMAKGKRRIS